MNQARITVIQNARASSKKNGKEETFYTVAQLLNVTTPPIGTELSPKDVKALIGTKLVNVKIRKANS